MTEKHTCCLCGCEFEGFGNNPEPLKENSDENRCCDTCNSTKVVPARIENMSAGKDPREVTTEDTDKEV